VFGCQIRIFNINFIGSGFIILSEVTGSKMIGGYFSQLRFFLGTTRLGQWAARVERTAGRTVDRAGYIPQQLALGALQFGLRFGDGF
jgi:hypothetical protein